MRREADGLAADFGVALVEGVKDQRRAAGLAIGGQFEAFAKE
ncbi:MAG: hypothetical protein WCQ21_08310 [Verrucomicrobiota bacterium]